MLRYLFPTAYLRKELQTVPARQLILVGGGPKEPQTSLKFKMLAEQQSGEISGNF